MIYMDIHNGTKIWDLAGRLLECLDKLIEVDIEIGMIVGDI